jgi:phospholipase/lecithinase/hemolysin
VRNFLKDYTNNELTSNIIPEPDRTLFVIWGGANDFLSRFDKKSDVNTFMDNPNAIGAGALSVADQTAFNVKQEVRGLVALGAKNILVVNLPDIGKTPRMSIKSGYHADTQQDQYDFATKLSEVIALYNQKLADAVSELQSTEKGAKIVLFDAWSALNNLMEGRGPNGESNFDYGIDMAKSFTNLESTTGQPPIKIGVRCYTGGYLGSTKDSDICKDPSTTLFWDEVHPTAKGHCGLAYLMHVALHKNGLIKTVPDFNSYKELCR